MKTILEITDSYLGEKPADTISVYSFLLAAGLGIFDYITGTELSFSVFYVIPVAMSTWYAKGSTGQKVALFSTLVWLLADLIPGQRYSHFLIPLWNSLVRLAFFMIIVALLSKLRLDLEIESSLADTDYLTGLPNKRSFFEQMENESLRSGRYRHPLTIIFFDLDNFKTVNDTRGHEEGDEVLRVIASTLRGNVRNLDVVGRLGGDEFAGFFPETGFDAASALVDHIHPLLNLAMRERGWPVTVSIGAVAFHSVMERTKDMVKLADDLMYNVKKSGKNNVLIKRWPTDADGQAMPGDRGRRNSGRGI